MIDHVRGFTWPQVASSIMIGTHNVTGGYYDKYLIVHDEGTDDNVEPCRRLRRCLDALLSPASCKVAKALMSLHRRSRTKQVETEPQDL